MVWWMIHKWLTRSGEELLIILMPLVKNEHLAHGDMNLCPERKKADITYRDEIEIFRYSKTRRLRYGLIWQQRISTCSPWGIEENIWNRTIVSHCKLSRKPVKWIRIWPSSACLAKCWRELAVVKVKKENSANGPHEQPRKGGMRSQEESACLFYKANSTGWNQHKHDGRKQELQQRWCFTLLDLCRVFTQGSNSYTQRQTLKIHIYTLTPQADIGIAQ